jgi:sialidase-1
MKFKHILSTGFVVATLVRSAAAAGLELAPVFVSGQNGYHTYRIPALIVTTNGTVLAFCEGRKKSRSDTGDIDLLVKRSTDGGRTWSAQQLVWSDDENTCGNPTPVVDQTTGIIWLLTTWNHGRYKEKEIAERASDNTRRVFILKSTDDGLTWSQPEEITAAVKKPGWEWYATGPCNGIQLARGPRRGRLVIPANHSARIGQGTNTVIRSHVFYSDDRGQTWQLGGLEEEKTNESTIVELSDGSLMQNMRSYHKANRRAVATSKDGGLTWSAIKLDAALIEPICQASILRYSWPERGEKSRILFSNPASETREKMTVRVSYDEGQTWAVSKLLHAGPAAYSSLTVLPDKTVACLFERGNKGPYENITLARFPISWLEQPE